MRIVEDWRIAAVVNGEIIVIGRDHNRDKVRSLPIKKIHPDFILEDIDGVKYQLYNSSTGYWQKPFQLLRPKWYEKFVENNILYGCMGSI